MAGQDRRTGSEEVAPGLRALVPSRHSRPPPGFLHFNEPQKLPVYPMERFRHLWTWIKPPTLC